MSSTVRIRVPELLTTREAARLLHLHPETVREMLRDGRIKGVRSNMDRRSKSHWRIRATEVQRLLLHGTQAAEAEEVVV